jgi:hypothetical protein
MTSICRTGLSVLAILCAAGCATRGNVDLLESQLRRQEDSIYALERQLESAESELASARHETVALQQQMASEGRLAQLPEDSRALHRATGMRFEKLLTGGLDRDGKPGHDLLAVALAPHDGQDEVVELQGAIQIEVLDLNRPEGDRRLGLWSFDLEQTPAHWRNGFLGSGYVFRLPWQRVPASRELLLHARMKTVDGREFSASHTVQIEPPGTAAPVAGDPAMNPFEVGIEASPPE